MTVKERLAMPCCALLFALVLFARRPDLVTHASFWGEDGWVWYPDAYAHGIGALARPYTGYLQSISRLVALASLAAPLAWAPTIFALAALGVQLATACFLVSSRLDDAWPSRPARIAFALLYLALPNSFETFGNITNTQWHLALLAFLVLVSAKPRGRAGYLFDAVVLLVSGLSGPFVLLLLPFAAWEAWNAGPLRPRHALFRFVLVALCASIQLAFVVPGLADRAPPDLGASPDRFVRILGQQVVLGVVLGRHSMDAYRGWTWWQDGILPWLSCGVGLVLGLAAWIEGPPLFRKFALFGALVLASALISPVGEIGPAWRALASPDIGDRYYLIPMLAALGVPFALAAHGRHGFRLIGWALLAITIAELPGDWHFGTTLAREVRTDFVARAVTFARSPKGTVMEFPVRPASTHPMQLIKR